MQTVMIVTKGLKATNTKGSRVKATGVNGISAVVNYRYNLNSEQNHQAAATVAAEKCGLLDAVLIDSSEDGCVKYWLGFGNGDSDKSDAWAYVLDILGVESR